jgi:hypothetical protein
MTESKHTPDIDRISVLSASILLAYTLAGFISLPSRTLSIQLPGLFLEYQVDEKTWISLLIAGLTATGADTLVRRHPAYQGRISIQHWLLPALTAWAIGLILFQEPFSILWWIIFALGGSTLVLVLIAEYIVVDLQDIRRIPATIALIAISFALFLIMVITIRSLEFRIFLMAPTIAIAAGLISLRALHLLRGEWAMIHASVIGVIIGQISAALHYLRFDPITFGLLLLAPTYALTSFSERLLDNRGIRQSILEPILVLLVIWVIAFAVR